MLESKKAILIEKCLLSFLEIERFLLIYIKTTEQPGVWCIYCININNTHKAYYLKDVFINSVIAIIKNTVSEKEKTPKLFIKAIVAKKINIKNATKNHALFMVLLNPRPIFSPILKFFIL